MRFLSSGETLPITECSRGAGAARRPPRQRAPSTGSPTSMPASAATAATVSGRSPEMTQSDAFDRRNATVSAASSRSRSPRTTRPSSCPIGGGAPSSTGPRAMPNARRAGPAAPPRRRLRQPAEREELRRAEHVGRLAEPHPLQRRRDENGTLMTGSSRRRAVSATASSVAFRAGELSAKRPSASVSSPSSTPFAGTTDHAERASVSVPVLSRQMRRPRRATRSRSAAGERAAARHRIAATAYVRLSAGSGLRHERHDGGDGRRHRVVDRRVPVARAPR